MFLKRHLLLHPKTQANFYRVAYNTNTVEHRP